MNQIQAGRMLTLAYFLKTQVKPQNFDMQELVYVDYEDYEQLRLKKPECGAAACAMGYMPVVFPRQWVWAHHGGVCRIDEALPANSPSVWLAGLRWAEAAEKFFGIDEYEVDYLFGPDEQRTPKQEAEILERFVESKGHTYA